MAVLPLSRMPETLTIFLLPTCRAPWLIEPKTIKCCSAARPAPVPTVSVCSFSTCRGKARSVRASCPVAVTRVILRSSSSILPKRNTVWSLALQTFSAHSCRPSLDMCGRQQSAPSGLAQHSFLPERSQPQEPSNQLLLPLYQDCTAQLLNLQDKVTLCRPPELCFYTPCLAPSISPNNLVLPETTPLICRRP